MLFHRAATTMRYGFERVLNAIQDPSNKYFLLASPEKPDGDSVGCVIAFREFLMGLRPDAECIMWTPEKLNSHNTLWNAFRPFCDPMAEITTELPDHYSPDVCLVFDYGNFWRLYLPREWEGSPRVLFIGFDHHGIDTGFPHNSIEIIGDSLSTVTDIAPSATTVLLYFFEFVEIMLGKVVVWPNIANALLIGLISDTGRFTNPAATEEAFKVATKLMIRGAGYQEILRLTQSRTSSKAFHAQTKARERVIFDDATGLAFFYFSQDDLKRWGVVPSEVLPLLGLLQNVEGVKIVVAYHEEETGGLWYCQIRITKGSADVNARKIACQFGGGGNPGAAGFKSSLDPEVLRVQLTEILEK